MDWRRGKLFFAVLFLVAVTFSLMSGCGEQNKRDNSCDCGPKDQCGSYEEPIALGREYVIQVDQNLSVDLQSQLKLAVESWNQYFQSQNQNIRFVTQSGPIDRSLRATDLQCQNSEGPSTVTLVQTTSDQDWRSLNSTSSNPAVTVRCAYDGKPTRQVIFVNPKYFTRTSGVAVLGHELGHVIGLKHSCADNNQEAGDDYISCSKLDSQHPYRQALMYPVIDDTLHSLYSRSPTSSSLDLLKSNDEERASCLLR